MIIKLLILYVVTVATYANDVNIPVTISGKEMFVESDDLLELALTQILVPSYSVYEVDVDDERAEGVYELKLYSNQELGADFQSKLQNILRSKLNFTNAEVRPRTDRNRNSNWHGMERIKYTILLDINTFRSNMENIAKNIVTTDNIRLRNSKWDR